MSDKIDYIGDALKSARYDTTMAQVGGPIIIAQALDRQTAVLIEHSALLSEIIAQLREPR
jgi:hypothetical protein